MPLSAAVEDGITGAEALVTGAGTAIRTWADAHNADLPTDASLTLAAPNANTASIRGVLLGYLAFGKRDKAIVAGFREIIKAWDATALKAELKEYYDFSRKAAQGVILMPSFRHGTSSNRENAKSTLASAATVMMKAYLAARQGKLGAGEERTRMVTWFGAFDDTRYGTVVANLKLLSDVLGTKPIRVYYRGTNIKGPSDKPNEDGVAPKKEAFASAFRAAVMPASYDRTFSHVTLGEKFFNFRGTDAGVGTGIAARLTSLGMTASANVQRPTTTFASTTGADSISGVLVHELSHNVCDTLDVDMPGGSGYTGKCYGQTKCRWLATNRPDDAITNADTYEYYFEEFQ